MVDVPHIVALEQGSEPPLVALIVLVRIIGPGGFGQRRRNDCPVDCPR